MHHPRNNKATTRHVPQKNSHSRPACAPCCITIDTSPLTLTRSDSPSSKNARSSSAQILISRTSRHDLSLTRNLEISAWIGTLSNARLPIRPYSATIQLCSEGLPFYRTRRSCLVVPPSRSTSRHHVKVTTPSELPPAPRWLACQEKREKTKTRATAKATAGACLDRDCAGVE